jgi:hypothetical protein
LIDISRSGIEGDAPTRCRAETLKRFEAWHEVIAGCHRAWGCQRRSFYGSGQRRE